MQVAVHEALHHQGVEGTESGSLHHRGVAAEDGEEQEDRQEELPLGCPQGPARRSEAEGMARHHARPLASLHARRVPLCSVQIRKAYGLGPYAMSGWGSSHNAPLLKLAWPSVESGGMSLEGAAYLVKRKEIRAAASAEEALAIRNAYADKMRESTTGLRAGRSFQFDDIIAPNQTRERIGRMLGRTRTARPATPRYIDLI